MTVSYQGTPFDGPWMQPLKGAVWGRCHPDFNSPLSSPRWLSWLCHHLICLCLLFPSVVGWRCFMILDYMIGPRRSNRSNRIVWWGWGKETTFASSILVIEYLSWAMGRNVMKFLALKNHSVPCYFSSLSDAQMDLRHPLRLSVKHQITYSHSLIDRLVPPLRKFHLTFSISSKSTLWCQQHDSDFARLSAQMNLYDLGRRVMHMHLCPADTNTISTWKICTWRRRLFGNQLLMQHRRCRHVICTTGHRG